VSKNPSLKHLNFGKLKERHLSKAIPEEVHKYCPIIVSFVSTIMRIDSSSDNKLLFNFMMKWYLVDSITLLDIYIADHNFALKTSDGGQALVIFIRTDGYITFPNLQPIFLKLSPNLTSIELTSFGFEYKDFDTIIFSLISLNKKLQRLLLSEDSSIGLTIDNMCHIFQAINELVYFEAHYETLNIAVDNENSTVLVTVKEFYCFTEEYVIQCLKMLQTNRADFQLTFHLIRGFKSKLLVNTCKQNGITMLF
jgi:hypothetical protein